MNKLRFLVVLFTLLFTFASSNVNAQCAMCTANAENAVKNGNTNGAGLNDGILYLLATPYLVIAGVGYIWYKRYKKRNVLIDMKEPSINLN